MAKKETPAKTPEAPVKPKPAKEPSEKEKLGRNSSCPCGSGKKYKYCCGRGRS